MYKTNSVQQIKLYKCNLISQAQQHQSDKDEPVAKSCNDFPDVDCLITMPDVYEPRDVPALKKYDKWMTLYMPDNMRRRIVAALATMHSRYLGDLFPAYAAFTLRLIPGKFKKVLRVFIQLNSTFVVITSCYIFWGFTPRHILDVRRLKTNCQKFDKSVWWFEFLFVLNYVLFQEKPMPYQ